MDSLNPTSDDPQEPTVPSLDLPQDQQPDVSNLAYGLDTHAAQAGDQSIFDQASDVVTKGIPLTGLQIVNSFVNTGIELANVFGANVDKWSIASEAPDVEAATGQSGLDDYYEAHKQGIDLASFAAGSLIPGMAGIKVFKYGTAAVDAWREAATDGEISSVLGRATGLLPSVRSKAIIDAAQDSILDSNSLFNDLQAEKYKAIAYGFGDQTLQALSYEVATAATMKASPLLDDKSFGETVDNIAFGALTGGAIGGVLEGLGTRAIFNKMLQTADDSTKAQQIVGLLGKGNYQPGDIVNTVLNKVYSMPEPASGLGGVLQKLTIDKANDAAKLALTGLVKDGDQELTNSLYDVITRMKNEGQMSQDDVFSTFANLAKVQRITDPVAPTIDDGSFFINKRVSTAGKNPINDINQLITSVADPINEGNITQRYTLKPGSSTYVIKSAADTTVGVDGSQIPLYKNAEAAFNEGADIFHNAKGDIIVNPKAPNIIPVPKVGESRPLLQSEEANFRTTSTNVGGLLKKPGDTGPEPAPFYGTAVDTGDKPGATILNTRTGSVTTSAIPTVGDHGSLVYTPKGLRYGDGNFSAQSLDSEITSETSTIDASARYAWMANRGIKIGDDISDTDIPGMETLYNHIMSGKVVPEGITFAGEEVPASSDLLEHIQNAKNDQLNEDLNGDMSSEEAALRANVPEDYIRNGFKAPNGTSDFILPPEANSQVSHVSLWYDIGNLQQANGMILKGIQDTQYRIQLIRTANQDAHAAYISSKGIGQDPANYIIDSVASDAGLTKAPGPGFFKISSANYDTAAQEYERVGRLVSGLNQSDIGVMAKKLTASANALRTDQDAANEAGMFNAVRHRTAESFSFLPPELEAKYMAKQLNGAEPTGNVAVLTKSLFKDDKGNLDFNPQYIPQGFVDASKIADGTVPTSQSGLRNFYTLSPKVADWERANQALNDERIIHRNNFNAANGIQRSLPTGTLYVPPLDTSKQPFFALLKARDGTGGADDSVGIITAKSQEELQSKIAQMADQYQVFTKNDIKVNHQILGDYQYDRNFAANRVNSGLARKGILNDVIPDTNVENIINSRVDWHTRQITGLNRDYTELANGQLFAELRSMGQKYADTATSKTGFLTPNLVKQQANPYQSYINTALNISPKEDYKLWAYANDTAEQLWSTAFDALRSGFQTARAGKIPYSKAADLAEKFGLGKIYETAADPLLAYTQASRPDVANSLKKFVASANGILGTGIVRLDWYQSFIHAVTTPMLAATEAVSAKTQLAKGLFTTTLPGTQQQIPAVSKLIYNAVKNFWDPAIHEKYGEMYDLLGADKTVIGQHQQMMDQLSLPASNFSQSMLGQKLSAAADLGAKLTGSAFTNTFNHFLSADIGRQLFEAAGFEGKGLMDNVMTFVNRVQGNYIAGQRPVAFQGPIGQAFGLFQTFGLNMLQNLTRYATNGETKTLALLGGLQTSLFGMQGMPGFNAINQHLVGNAAGNSSHADIYSGVASGLGAGRGSIGDYLLYGVASNWLNANLYTRGDISPRNMTVFPVDPINIPTVRAGINIVFNLLATQNRISQGAPLGASLLLGLEHNGLSRPLSGLAQMAQGFSTNQNGQIIGTTQGVNGQSELFSIGNFSRLMGARPLDEAATYGALQRMGVYTAKREAQIQSIGEAAKTAMYAGSDIAPEEVENLASRYAAVGGDINKFNSAMTRWSSQANASTANKVFDKLKDPIANNAMLEMGGRQLPDYLNTGQMAAANQTVDANSMH